VIFIDNAIKFSHEDSLIEIGALKDYQGIYNPENLDGVLINFRDNGIGIKEVDLEHIFQRFYRGENANYVEGTGLGMSIALELTKLHQGHLNLESKDGIGTTIHLFIPYSSEAENNLF
jgi:signal transduction histidine kinase